MSAATLICVCQKGLLMRQLLERPMEGSAAKLRAQLHLIISLSLLFSKGENRSYAPEKLSPDRYDYCVMLRKPSAGGHAWTVA